MSGRALAFWRSLGLGLWLACGLLPLLAQPQREPLPACCRADGRHHCAMRTSRGAEGSSAVVTALCDAGTAKTPPGTLLTALRPNLPQALPCDAEAWKAPSRHSLGVTPDVVVYRASRAPPRRLV
jgi:hypothetical protein